MEKESLSNRRKGHSVRSSRTRPSKRLSAQTEYGHLQDVPGGTKKEGGRTPKICATGQSFKGRSKGAPGEITKGKNAATGRGTAGGASGQIHAVLQKVLTASAWSPEVKGRYRARPRSRSRENPPIE